MARSYLCVSPRNALTGGGDGALDQASFHTNQTQDGDIALVFLSDKTMVYVWDDDSGLDDDGYDVIKPDSYTGDGRWIIVASFDHQLDKTIDSGTYLPTTLNNLAEIERATNPIDCGDYSSIDYTMDGGSY